MAEEVAELREILLPARSLDSLSADIGNDARAQLDGARLGASRILGGRTIWWVNSAAQGGGVAEMLRTLLPYWRGEGLAARWLVLTAPLPFFRFTKRLHNLLHGFPVSAASARERALYDEVSRRAGEQLKAKVKRDDIVVLEDPQVAGLARHLLGSGAVLVWRSHCGTEETNEHVDAAWRFLEPRIADASAFVFSRPNYIPGFLAGRAHVIPPAVDPHSPKNQCLTPMQSEAVLRHAGLATAAGPRPPARVSLEEGGSVDIRRRANVLREGQPPHLGAEPLVVALARWDWLKDPLGVIAGFAERVAHLDARLIIAGPAAGSVADDPGEQAVLRAARAAWQALPRARRRAIDVVSLPMVDLDENALMVNALQRRADVIVKKSLQEGFGLGVTEGLWKSRPVLATAVGGHKDQIEHGRTGLLLRHPADLREFGLAIDRLLGNGSEARALAEAGHVHVREHFLADSHFARWIAFLGEILGLRAR